MTPHHRTWAVAGLLFASGFCALVYQIGWLREFRLIFGASAHAGTTTYYEPGEADVALATLLALAGQLGRQNPMLARRRSGGHLPGAARTVSPWTGEMVLRPFTGR